MQSDTSLPGFPSVFRSVFRKEMLRRVRSPLAPAMMLLFPVLFSLLIGLAFGSHGENIAPIKIALADEDGGLFARLLRSSFTQERAGQRFDLVVAPDAAAGLRLVENNKVSALLRIPPGFTDSLLSGNPTHLELVKNPAQGIDPEIAEQAVKVLAQAAGSAVRVLGDPVRQIHDAMRGTGPPGDEFVAGTAVAISRRMEGVGRYALPPAIRLEKTKADAGDGKKSGGSQIQIALFVLPGMAVFALLMLALVAMADFQRESARGTLARQYVAPVSFAAVVLGKMAAGWVLSFAVVLILAVLALFWAGGGIAIPAFAALSLAVSLAAVGFAAFIHAIARSERTGSAVGSVLIMIMSMAGGSFIPPESLPAFARAVAPFTLNYWGNSGYRDLLFEGAGLARIAPDILVLAGLGVLFGTIALLRFGRRYGTGRAAGARAGMGA